MGYVPKTTYAGAGKAARLAAFRALRVARSRQEGAFQALQLVSSFTLAAFRAYELKNAATDDRFATSSRVSSFIWRQRGLP